MRLPIFIAIGLIPYLLSGCNDDLSNDDTNVNTIPNFIQGELRSQHYNGVDDDLLTAGLGVTGLKGAAPSFTDPTVPTVNELRRNAIFNNYRALVDYTDTGGFGRLYGPNIDAQGHASLGEGKVAGHEMIAVVDDGTGQQNVTLMVQVPDTFNPDQACIITATSSGSRGIYGAIGTSGEWGLKKGCAVAYTDKGTGNGLHDLMSNQVLNLQGQLVDADTANKQAQFKAALSANERADYNGSFPNRVAYKHAHSGQNPEKDWGKNTLQAIEFAFYAINELHGDQSTSGQRLKTFKPSNTIVIASSVSNGGGAALAAAEQDTQGWIDAVAVSEPNAQPGANPDLILQQGDQVVSTHSKPLIDYFSYANLYQPCAVLSPRAGLSLNAAFWPEVFTQSAANRCAGLAAKGLLQASDLSAQAEESLDKLHAYGWQTEHDFLHQSHYRFATNSIVVTYINTYGRFKPTDNVCGFSFANTSATDGTVVAQNPALQAGLFTTGNGVPPTTGINIVYNEAVGGARLDLLAASPTSGLSFPAGDFALDGALCMRSLVTGIDPSTGQALMGDLKAQSDRVKAGLADVQLTANLQGKPTIIVAGRSDTLVPPNHAARAYVGKSRMQGATAANLSYIEVTHAQHFDTFIAFGALLGYDTRFVPLHVYFSRSLDAMWEHLTEAKPLPASQVVHAVPRGQTGSAPLAAANVPAWKSAPSAAEQITFTGNTLTIPN